MIYWLLVAVSNLFAWWKTSEPAWLFFSGLSAGFMFDSLFARAPINIIVDRRVASEFGFRPKPGERP